MNIDEYARFVVSTASEESQKIEPYVRRLLQLEEHFNVAMLHTGSAGLASEGGEFAEIVKKITFQGKPVTPETITHMKKELGDIGWYWVLACQSLGINPSEIIEMNRDKLEHRYPNGFSVHNSENRAEGDI